MTRTILNQGYPMPLLIEVTYREDTNLGDVSSTEKVFWAVSAWGKSRKECFQRLRLNDVTHFMFTGVRNGGITMLGGRKV